MTYWTGETLSPDPTREQEPVATQPLAGELLLYPHALVRAEPPSPSVRQWAASLNLFRRPEPLVVTTQGAGRVPELVLDFGTELHGNVSLEVETQSAGNVIAVFGESAVEAEGYLASTFPCAQEVWHVAGGGRHRYRFERTRYATPWGFYERKEARGFRFLRLSLFDFSGTLTLYAITVQAEFIFRERLGDMRLQDSRWQKAWQASIYTARLCSRPDALWDGIKRDRVGWHGDGRIIKLAVDLGFHRPEPSESLLMTVPTNQWACGVPVYSFDACAMLRDHIQTYGLERPVLRDAFRLIGTLLDWVSKTQVNEDGLIIRREDQSFFGDIGFLDWSEVPVGGRFEELCWLQARYVGGLREAAQVAAWLGEEDRRQEWAQRADALAGLILKRFWRADQCFIHTQNHVGPVGNVHLPGFDGHYRKTYVEKVALGPSGPTRHSNAIAILAGIADPGQCRQILRAVFDNPRIPPVITPYFSYYEQTARALCGDSAGAWRTMADYIATMIEREDATTLWETYDPEVRDLRRFFSHLEPGFFGAMSLCHGWGSGLVPLSARWLAGIDIVAPGYSRIRLDPAPGLANVVFSTTVPTPYGLIYVAREAAGDPVCYRIPDGIDVVAQGDGLILRKGDRGPAKALRRGGAKNRSKKTRVEEW